jgi:hypothetical protein
MTQWQTIGGESVAGGKVTHVMPINDLKEHTFNAGCWCSPQLDEEHRAVIHNSADNREAFERGERMPS